MQNRAAVTLNEELASLHFLGAGKEELFCFSRINTISFEGVSRQGTPRVRRFFVSEDIGDTTLDLEDDKEIFVKLMGFSMDFLEVGTIAKRRRFLYTIDSIY